MTPEQHKKLTDDAVYLASTHALAAQRVTTAERELKDAKHYESIAHERLIDAIKQLSNAAKPAPLTSR